MYEVSKCAPQEALRDLDRAFKNFFSNLKKGKKPGFPKFKKKGLHDHFRLTGSIKVNEKSIPSFRLNAP
jgi:putative transposase